MSAVPVVTRPSRNFFGARAPGAAVTRPSPRPLMSKRANMQAKLGRNAPRERALTSLSLRDISPRVVPAKAGTHNPRSLRRKVDLHRALWIDSAVWVPAFAGTTTEVEKLRQHRPLRLGRGPRGDAVEPGGDVGVGGVERLADGGSKCEHAIEQDVGERKPLAAEKIAAVGHLLVQPLQAVGRDLLQAGRGFRHAHDTLFEEPQALAEAEAVGHGLGDVEVDATRPHPAFGALFGRRADQGRVRMGLLEIFADRHHLGEVEAVVELERRHLAHGVALQMRLLPVLAAAQVHGLPGDLDALLRDEHADDVRVRPDRIVKLHVSSLLPVLVTLPCSAERPPACQTTGTPAVLRRYAATSGKFRAAGQPGFRARQIAAAAAIVSTQIRPAKFPKISVRAASSGVAVTNWQAMKVTKWSIFAGDFHRERTTSRAEWR